MVNRVDPHDERIPAAVLGATGSVGQRFVQLLARHPWFRVSELVASDRSTGKRYGDATDWRLDASMPEEARELFVRDYDADLASPVVFSALPGEVAGEIEQRMAREGRALFSNTSTHRMDPDVPLLIPEVNPDHVVALDAQRRNRGWSGLLVTNPNCSAIHLVLALKPLHDAFGIDALSVTTMQAVSGAGYPGVSSLDMIDNVVPFIPGEEEKMTEETMKLLGGYDGGFVPAAITMTAHCNRVPVRDGHTECVSIRLKGDPSLAAVADAFASFRGRPQELDLPSAPKQPVVVREERNRPQPVLDRDTEHGMASVVGRIRPCPLLGVKFVVLGHNTIRGAAGASILNAELFKLEGLLPV
ncbi:MAG TPA: aspartate-semialdehyde dehydrogenase [Thermomicrobiales bacterium]|nr:aspartate-semialdehyde dehydrogenase [Thermomicrobiales bacterium]